MFRFALLSAVRSRSAVPVTESPAPVGAPGGFDSLTGLRTLQGTACAAIAARVSLAATGAPIDTRGDIMNRLHVAIDRLPDELRRGVRLLMEEYPIAEAPSADARTVVFRRGDGPLAISTAGGTTTVRYAAPVQAFRAIGKLLGGLASGEVVEEPRFTFLGLMLDVSRNAVHTPENVRRWVRRLALMGINALTLYAEDTYEVPGEPFFGYGRGPYTEAELRAADDYAGAFGIEMFPCIQTLAHLEQVLQWPEYREITDVGGILLAEDERTYAFVERIIRAAMAPFRSRRIHLGMDEAHGLGTGRYRQIHGEKRRFDIMVAHLQRVLAITRSMDLKPMMWSDMWFRIGSKGDDYYDREAVIPDDVIAMIPRDVTQVYWDYYHTDEEFYRDWIRRHRKLGSEPLVAPGAWTWGHFWAYYPFAYGTVEPCMRACKAEGVKEVLMTMWGDDGAECDFMSALPVLQYYAEHGYRETPDDAALRTHFHGVTGGDYDAWLRAAGIDALSTLEKPEAGAPNPSKWLLWEDPMLGLWQPLLDGHSFAAEYAALADELEAAATHGGLLGHHLRFPAQIARVLTAKCDLPTRIRAAYAAGDRAALRAISDEMPALIDQVRRLWRTHRAVWFSQHKPQGWEVIEGRYGHLVARLETSAWRIDGYLGGAAPRLPELEERHEKRATRGDLAHLPQMGYQRIVAATAIK